mmetsp:Transcript_17395/g.29267  ORF Transcript_17395/g.29267 Transcript_17395/m.29267 type:complete len:207 (+) Transcript_17395:410-1030(+)
MSSLALRFDLSTSFRFKSGLGASPSSFGALAAGVLELESRICSKALEPLMPLPSPAGPLLTILFLSSRRSCFSFSSFFSCFLKEKGSRPEETCFSFSSMTQLYLSSIFFTEPIPKRGTQSSVIWSYTILERFCLAGSPFSRRNLSHFVNYLGLGMIFCLGNTTFALGKSTLQYALVYSRISPCSPSFARCSFLRSKSTFMNWQTLS